MIDPSFRNISILSVLSLKNGDYDPARNSSHKYYTPLAEIRDFNALIKNKLFFGQTIKTSMKGMKTCQNVTKQRLCNKN